MVSLLPTRERANAGLATSDERLFTYRRPALVAVSFATAFLILQGFYLWSDTWSTKDAFSAINPIVDKPTETITQPVPHATIQTEKSQNTHSISSSSDGSQKNQETSSHSPEQPSSEVKTSALHYVVPASSPNHMLCAVVASALANRYPIPYIVGWKEEGKYNASAAHFAKLYTIQRYLHQLPHGGEDDDLIIFGDGHDVVAQLPAEVMIERYFELAADADRRLADRFGISVEEAHKRGLKQTLFWGADKMCWPNMPEEAQCSRIPGSHLPQNVFGAKSGNDDFTYQEAKFLNSGSVIGPIGDLRTFVDAGITEMETTFDEHFKYRNSDQVYLARLYGRQEVSRIEQAEAEARAEVEEYKKPKASGKPKVAKEPGKLKVSKEPEKPKTPKETEETKAINEHKDSDDAHRSEDAPKPDVASAKRSGFVKSKRRDPKEVVEYHLAIDYESVFVQTGCYNHKWMRMLPYNNSDNSATVKEDPIGHGKYFEPYNIQMPANVYKAFQRVFHSLGEDQPATSARAWIGSLQLDTNIITKSIFGFYHATCSKANLIRDFKTYWFHPLIEPLMRAAARSIQKEEAITETLIDGRQWVHKKIYPSAGLGEEKLGGVFTDYIREIYIPYMDLCAEHLGILQSELGA